MPLTITNIAPNYSPIAGGATVVITGTQFSQSVRVTFGGVKAKSVRWVNATSLEVVTPALDVARTVVVRVTNDPGYISDGPSVNRVGFNYYSKITAIAPAELRTTGGTDLTLTGVGFPVGAEVSIDGIRAHNVVRVSATTITCQSRQHDAGEVDVLVCNPGDPVGYPFRLHYCEPLISSLSPAAGTPAGGTDVTIHGKHFHDANVDVHFDGQLSPHVNVVSPTQLVARTPAHLAGVVNVQVTNPLRPQILAAPPIPLIPAVPAVTGQLDAAFEFAGPAITSIEPKIGPAGGGTDVTIRGRGFLVLAPNGVQIGGVAALNVHVVDAGTITARTGAAAAGPGAVTVQNNNGDPLATLASGFTFVAQPTITAVEPPRGPAGIPITIQGRDFVAGARVRIGGVMATGVRVVSSTAIVCTAPAHALGAVLVEVRNDKGEIGSLAGGFTYTALSLAPARGLAAGGEQVTLRLPGPVPDDATITFDGLAAARVGGAELRVTTPLHAVGAVDVVVGGQTLAGGFVYSTITRIEPKAGPAGTTVTIHGAGFDHTTTVAFDVTDAGAVNVVSGTEITVTSPAHANGAVDVVLGGGGAGTFALGYTYQVAATVTAIAPATATQAGGTPITITGTGFVAGAAVVIDGNPIGNAEVVSPTTITGTVPAIPAALAYPQVDVEVTNPGAAAAAVGANLFQYRAAPTVTAAANPALGPVGGGRAITVTGQGFVDGAKVIVDGTAVADTVFVNATTLRARVPAHAAAAVGVAVQNPEDPAAGPTRAATFTYVVDPHTSLGQNFTDFVLDGETYFELMRLLFEMVRQAPRDPKGLTYVRLAFWMICDDVTLGDRTFHGRANHRLLCYIEQVARAGHHVEVIMWRPKKHEQYFGEGKGVYESNRAFADKMYALDVSLAAVPGAGRARVYFEAYEGETGASNHQKIAIFSLAGQRHVMIGGINLSNGYFGADDHMFPDPTSGWHDAAIYLRGPITDDVEKEWKRRWDRTRALEDGWYGMANQLGSGGEVLARDFAFFQPTLVRQREIATEDNQTIQDPEVDDRQVMIALTRSVGTTRAPRLRDKVIERINAANHTIYFENYHFSDPDLVQAIVARHAVRAAAGANLSLTVVVPYPMGPTSSYMTRRAWLHMVLSFVDGTTNTPYCTEVIYDLGAGAGTERVARAACGANWTVTDCYDPARPLDHNWLEADTLTFRVGMGPPVVVRFSQILAVDGDLHFYAPQYYDGNINTLYTHSKIASFDDQWLVVGSANWSFRSMQYDGEISAFVDDAAVAAPAVQALLDHYSSATAPGTVALGGVEAEAMANLGAPPMNAFSLYPLDVFDNGAIDTPILGLQREPPPALEVTSVIDFARNPAEPNYTWL